MTSPRPSATPLRHREREVSCFYRLPPMLEKKITDTIYSRISRCYQKCSIYVFGSHVYGAPSAGSDIDIAVILDEVASKVAESNKIYNLLDDIPYPKDIVVSSVKEFDHFSRQAGSIYRTILEKGLLLHG